MIRLVVIDRDSDYTDALRQALAGWCHVVPYHSASLAVDVVASHRPDVVLLDLHFADGFRLLEEITRLPGAPALIASATVAETRNIVTAMRRGAVDFIEKGTPLSAVKDAVRRAASGRACRFGMGVAESDTSIPEIIGESDVIADLKCRVQTYAKSDYTVLLYGESGSGKELVARAIHRLSRRREAPFVAVNCAAMPDTLFEAEFFGVERGAYTDALARAGLFERASGGTIFLDEIGELSALNQGKLLRVLEDGETVRLGGTQPRRFDVRVVAATNRDLAREVTASRYRNDLYYRIADLVIHLPPLRDRITDIPLLTEFFLRDSPRPVVVSAAAMDRLTDHVWPGNVRELRSVIRRAVLTCTEGRIEARDIVFN